ncbi:hypothetical protein CVO77_00335 [Sphingopyxis lindanitolerans]|uniref:Uncharacterized protein n=1 Tax=Sphingopyxis lindanitolerans TaxID=2054227 RepID=A0A2S8BAI3_9SPHN|nr:hypothetical protein [Sphingopyxis lindanitolerans]PQM29421.1 hypothetical protein CVO77_00335 [Sphingopyxis lindanitolerans]
MATASTLLACASSSLAAAGLTALYFRSRLSAARASANLFRQWWERDSARMIIAEAQVDLTRQQRIDAGKLSHKAEREVIDARTEDLRLCNVARKSHPLEGALAAPTSPAREGCGPSAPFSKIPAGVQQPGKRAERSHERRSHRQDAEGPSYPTRLAKGDSIDPECRLAKPRGVIPPLLTNTTMKGA